MNTKKIIIALTILFITTMLFFTIFSQSIHNGMIPNVQVTHLTKQSFEYKICKADGITKETVVKQSLAIPKKLYHQGDLYTIANIVKNGSTRTITQKLDIEVGLENDVYYEIANTGHTPSIILIIKTNKEFLDGDEVYVID